ncbi:Hypothetical protein NTJ_14324 [Nesidiocoris tenuis]|uniref:Cystatin domain-containing protein n=1 Tax=Nesidiocoris tenuis TaxID=355587 RepID=A0ABN7BCV1_9HEMI|nr:Hypothetical protein NTJ_14324 [Nesidiocoris tenuis]
MGAYEILILLSVVAAAMSHPMIKRDADVELSESARGLIKEHLGPLIGDRTNSDFTQVVTKMDVVHVERYGHGYKVDVNVRLSDTNCSRNSQDYTECLPTNKNEQECTATITMVQPQGGRKWYKLNDADCRAV